MRLSVIVPTHNPDSGRLRRVTAGLQAQTLARSLWEAVIVDNASSVPVEAPFRVVPEERLGLTAARLRGFSATAGDVLVLADDDNVLAPDYLERALAAMDADSALGAAGGRSIPEFAAPPPAWVREFDGLLACRDPGDNPERAVWTPDLPRSYPLCSPLGAGLVLRRAAVDAYERALARDPRRLAFDRTGTQLVSGGDNDLVMTALEAGFAVAYRPELVLTHLIPSRRTESRYLGALNRAIARSWVRVLDLHGIRPWPPASRLGLPARRWRAWVRSRAWRGDAEWVRWQGLCGNFEGRADISE